LYIDGAYPEEKLEPTTFKCYLQVVSSYAEDNLMFDGLKRVQIPSHTLTVDNQFVEVVAELSEEQLNHINKGNKIVLTLKKDNLPLIAEYTI
jgi:hypothetical protein